MSPAISVPGDSSEGRRLVHLEADPVSERMEEALLEHLSRRLAALRRQAGPLVRLAREPVQLLACRPGRTASNARASDSRVSSW